MLATKAGHENFTRDTFDSLSVRISSVPQGKVKRKPYRGRKFPIVKRGEEFNGFGAHLIFLSFSVVPRRNCLGDRTDEKEFCA